MANWVMLHRLGYNLNLYIGFEDQNFKDVQRLLAGLQNQYACYSYNLVGETSPN